VTTADGRLPTADHQRRSVELVPVQHHHAHLAACLAENGVEGPALGVTWDGTGYGTDGTVWGGEFLLGDAADFTRVAHLRPFRLPGGDAAIKEPRRAALATLWELYGEAALEREDLAPVRAFRPAERRLLAQMLERGINAPITTSAGRLFDAIAALVGLNQTVTFEGQAAMALEFAADAGVDDAYSIVITGDLSKGAGERGSRGAGEQAALARASGPGVSSPPWLAPAGRGGTEKHGSEEKPLILGSSVQKAADFGELSRAVGGPPSAVVLDWQPLLEAVLEDLQRGVKPGIIAGRFHNALVETILAVAQVVGEPRVALTGGCFQNRLLTERAAQRLSEAGFEVLLHRQVPPNDGGISLGQVAVAAARLDGKESIR
jgi:hydrogenase maturation protein HypF